MLTEMLTKLSETKYLKYKGKRRLKIKVCEAFYEMYLPLRGQFDKRS